MVPTATDTQHKQLQTILHTRILESPQGLAGFAKKASVSRPTLYNFLEETSFAKFRPSTIDRIAKALKVPSAFGKRVNMTDAWKLERVLKELDKHPGHVTIDAIRDRVVLAIYRALKKCGDAVRMTLRSDRKTLTQSYDIEIGVGGPNMSVRLSAFFDQNKALFELFSRSRTIEVKIANGVLSATIVGVLAEYICSLGREIESNRRKYDVESLKQKLISAQMPGVCHVAH